MDCRAKSANFSPLRMATAHLSDGFSRSFAHDARAQNETIAARNDLDQSKPIIFVDGTVDLALCRKT